jgi:hypothetical protein
MSQNNQHAEPKSDVRAYGFGRHTVHIAPLDDEWAIIIDAVPMGVAKCPVTALLAAKKHLGVDDDK